MGESSKLLVGGELTKLHDSYFAYLYKWVAGVGPMRLKNIFSKQLCCRSKVIQRTNCLRNTLQPPNLVRRITDQSVYIARVTGHTGVNPGSTKGQIAQK